MREEWASRQREEKVLRPWEADSGAHSPPPGLCGQTTTVRGQRDFTEGVKDADLKEPSDYPGLSGNNGIMWPLKSRRRGRKDQSNRCDDGRRYRRDLVLKTDLTPSLLVSKMKQWMVFKSERVTRCSS